MIMRFGVVLFLLLGNYCDQQQQNYCADAFVTFQTGSAISTKTKQQNRYPAVLFVASVTRNNDNDYSTTITNKEKKEKEYVFEWTRQWYPAIPTSYVDEATKPIGLTILNQKLVVWKESTDKYSVLSDICPHRKAPLSTGKIIENDDDDTNNIMCRYHGWEFNGNGGCEKIPMMEGNTTKSKAFCATSYPVQVHDGLLWVYMDPTDPSPTDFPFEPQVTKTKANAINMILNPISYQAMLENSFDPSHAPFTHEGKNAFTVYSPNQAIPMKSYRLLQNSTTTIHGFTLEHTPYEMKYPGQKSFTTTRQFIPPCTNTVISPIFNSTIHTVPVSETESMSLVMFSMPTSTTTPSSWRQKLFKRILARKWLDDLLHFYFIARDGNYKFLTQDRLIMQGQDERKAILSSLSSRDSVKEILPTQSDMGVKTLQHWMNTFGKGGPFATKTSQKTTYNNNNNNNNNKELSLWDSHAQFCPACQRTLSRCSQLDRFSRKFSKISLFNSAVLTIVHAITTKKVWLPLSILSLVVSIGFHRLSQFCQTVLERTIVPGNLRPHTKLMQIYPE